MEASSFDRDRYGFETTDLDSIKNELKEQISKAGIDIRIAAFYEAVLSMLMDPNDDRLRLSVGFMLDFRSDPDTNSLDVNKEEPFTPQYAVSLLLRAFQHTIFFIRKYPMFADTEPGKFLDYPYEFDNPSVWLREMDAILSNSSALGVLDYDLAHRRIQSNIAERYKGPKLAILKDYYDRFSGPLNILDVGASLNLGLTKLMTGLQFRDIEVVQRLTTNERGYSVDEASTIWANTAINSGLQVSTGIGVDILPVWDPNTREWVRSCSFYPSELLDPSRTNEFDILATANEVLDGANLAKTGLPFINVNLGELKHYTGDFSDRNSMRDFKTLVPDEKFHVVMFLTMLHQLTPKKRASMLARAKRFLRDDGLIIIQDFMHVNEQAPNMMDFPPHWTDFMYKTCVIDPLENDQPRESIIWDFGRCKQAVLL